MRRLLDFNTLTITEWVEIEEGRTEDGRVGGWEEKN
jgi:hypothetical protein